MTSIEYYRKRKEEGICVRCGARPAVSGRVLCKECGEKERERARAKIQQRKSEGLCITCGKRPPDPGFVDCNVCRERNRESLDRRRKERRKLSLCYVCGAYVEDGQVLCPECRKKANDRWHDRQDYRRENGLCLECGKKPAEEGDAVCSECREKQKTKHSETYYWYKEHGICVYCHKNPADKGTLCFECWTKRQEQAVERDIARSPEEKERLKLRDKEYNQKRREQLRADGLCIFCGKRPAREGLTLCEQCSKIQKIRLRRMRAGKLSNRQMRIEHGLCPLCGEPSAPGKQYCERHIEMHRRLGKEQWAPYSLEERREILEQRGFLLSPNCIRRKYRRWNNGNTDVQRQDSEH